MKNLLKSNRFQRVVAVTVLLVTLGLFVRFFHLHPQYLTVFTHLRAITIFWIIFLNLIGLTILVGINQSLLRFCGVQLNLLEQFQLTSYSAVTNFFGPFQSGPGVRALYLKARYGLRLRDYFLATVIYYGLFAVVSAVAIAWFAWKWWLALGLITAVALIAWLVVRWALRRSPPTKKGFHLDRSALIKLIFLTILQVGVISLWYFVELRAVASSVTFHQTLIYTGAANFALFVSLTPDAIGFREAFLLFAQRLHHLPTAAIVSANLIDRAVYALFLGGLFLVVLVTHLPERFRVSRAPKPIRGR